MFAIFFSSFLFYDFFSFGIENFRDEEFSRFYFSRIFFRDFVIIPDVYGGARGAAAVAFLESFRLFLSKKLIMIEILRSFLQYRIDAILTQNKFDYIIQRI